MQCDLCGKLTSELYVTSIESVSLRVCALCTKHGTISKKLTQVSSIKKKKDEPSKKAAFFPQKGEEIEEEIVENYSSLIKSAREKKKMTQAECAKALNEKESYLHNIESGHSRPSIALAKKLGHYFGIKLIEEISLKGAMTYNKSEKSANLTLGDIIKFK